VKKIMMNTGIKIRHKTMEIKWTNKVAAVVKVEVARPLV